MTSPSLLSLVAFLLFLVFLYSNGSYSNTLINNRTDGLLNRDTRPLASKTLLHRDNLNAYLSPHIYNVFTRKEYQLTELTEPPAPGNSQGGEACLEQATQFCSSEQLRVAQVSFMGSDMKWTLCHCIKKAPDHGTQDPEPWLYLVSRLSRLPVPLRRQIPTIMLAPLSRSPLVTSTRPQQSTPHGMFTASPPLVTFFGYPSIGTWIHEFAHAADFHYSSTMFSASKQWTRALERAGCVTDAYARTNREEALAQAAIVKAYLAGRPRVSSVYSSRNIKGTFTETSYPPTPAQDYTDTLLGDYSCMKDQLMALGCLDAFLMSAERQEGCAELENAGNDMPASERRELVPRSGTWWELWLVTDLLIILFMLAQL